MKEQEFNYTCTVQDERIINLLEFCSEAGRIKMTLPNKPNSKNQKWLIKNHAFFDGNKRIGIYAMLVFLELNGMEMECSEEELIALGFGIASGEIEEKDVGGMATFGNRFFAGAGEVKFLVC